MKLRDQLILRTVALAALAFGIFGAILIQFSFHFQFSREKEALDTRSAQLVQSMEAAAVNYVLQNISLTDDLAEDILHQMDPAAVLNPPEITLISEGLMMNDRMLTALRPAQLGGTTYHIAVFSDLSALYHSRHSLLIIYTIIFLSIIALFSLLMTLTANSLTRPIEHLAKISTQLAGGNMAVRAQPDDCRETAALAHSFNSMADSLTGQIERQQRFIADLTHEMKTPLTAIIGHADLIRSGRVKAEEAALAAHSILKEGQRLNALTARLIDLILLQQDQAELHSVSIRPLIEEAVEALRPAASERGIELSENCADAIFLCDRTLMLSLITNLIDNALKSDASHIHIEGNLVSKTYTLSVSDDGCGMTPEVLQKITEPFYRADKSRSRKQGGAGLGLSLCKEIAELHHAILTFESMPGKGTSAFFSILARGADSDAEA